MCVGTRTYACCMYVSMIDVLNGDDAGTLFSRVGLSAELWGEGEGAGARGAREEEETAALSACHHAIYILHT